MSDVLSYLGDAVERVEATLMPSELDSVAQFLCGRAWVTTCTQDNATLAKPTSANNSGVATTHESGVRRMRAPLGLVAWHECIPLAIAASSLASMGSARGRSTLSDYFASNGFARVLAMSFIPTEQLRNITDIGEDDIAFVPTTGNSAGSAQSHHKSTTQRSRDWDTVNAARHGCVEAVRAWCSAVEKEARRQCDEQAPRCHADEVNAPVHLRTRTVVRRLLVMAHCTADNRIALSTAATASSIKQRSGLNAGNQQRAASAAQRHRHGGDPLHLFLHDLAATATLYEARLQHTSHRIRMAVLLLPEDHVYGAAPLARVLREEVGHAYCVRLYLSDADTSTATVANQHWRGAPLARARRLVEHWNPQAIPHTCTSSGASGEGTAEETEGQWTSFEQALMREHTLFFLRPGNLPLCCFLREALRRFPLLLCPASLRLVQAAWTSRHSLDDVLIAFHSLTMPFVLSTTHREWHQHDNEEDSITVDSSSPPALRIGGRKRTERDGGSPAEVEMDHSSSVDVIDSLLEAAGILCTEADAGDRWIEEAIVFALLYEDAVHKRGVRLLRIPGVVDCLCIIHARAGLREGRGPPADEADRAAQALQWLKPFSSGCGDGGVEQPPPRAGRRHTAVPFTERLHLPRLSVSLAAQLQRSVLPSVLPPHESLAELRTAAALSTTALHQRIRDLTAAPGTLQQQQPPRNAAMAISRNNFYSALIPDSARVLYLLTTHALHCRSAVGRHVPLVQLQAVCQLSDESMVRVLKELSGAGLASVNLRTQTARTLLDR